MAACVRRLPKQLTASEKIDRVVTVSLVFYVRHHRNVYFMPFLPLVQELLTGLTISWHDRVSTSWVYGDAEIYNEAKNDLILIYGDQIDA